MKATVIVCSDSAAAGRSEDTTGPVLVSGLRELGHNVAGPMIVPDDVPAITAAIEGAGTDVVVCTGGTGLGPRDVTPDAVLSVIDRELPGFGEAFRALGRQHTPLADLSRAAATGSANSWERHIQSATQAPAPDSTAGSSSWVASTGVMPRVRTSR